MAALDNEQHPSELDMMFRKARNTERDDIIRLKQLFGSVHQTLEAIKPFVDMMDPNGTSSDVIAGDQISLISARSIQCKTATTYKTILKTGLTQLASLVKVADLTELQEKPTFVLVLEGMSDSDYSGLPIFHKRYLKWKEEYRSNIHAPALPYKYYSISDPRDAGSIDAWLGLLRKQFRLQDLSLDFGLIIYNTQDCQSEWSTLYSSLASAKQNQIEWNEFKTWLCEFRSEETVEVEINATIRPVDKKQALMKDEIGPVEGFYATVLSQDHPSFRWQFLSETYDD